MKIQITIAFLFLEIFCYSQKKIMGYFDYDINKDYILHGTKTNDGIYLYKNGGYKKNKIIPSLDFFFDDYDESTANFFINKSNENGTIIIGAERGASLKVTKILYFKYISNMDNWFLYKEENSEVEYEDHLPNISVDYHPYSLGIDGKKYPANEKLYLQDSLQNKKISETIFNEEYNKLKSSKYLKKYDFKYSYEDLYLLIKNIPITEINIDKYNNLAFYIAQNEKKIPEAIYLYKQILQKYPNRTVAYLNLADSYWAIGNQDLAKEHYKKYVEQMKSQNKDLKKISKEVWIRVK